MKSWRLSFQSNKLTKQLRKHWNDYISVLKSDDEIDVSKLKTLITFLDALLGSHEHSISTSSVFEELGDDIVSIFAYILKIVKHLGEIFYDNGVNLLSDLPFGNEALTKSVSALELIATVKSNHGCFKDKLLISNPFVSLTIDTVCSMKVISHQLILIRVLRSLIFDPKHLIELIEVQGFQKLSELVKKSNDHTLITQVLSIFQTYGSFAAQVILYEKQLEMKDLLRDETQRMPSEFYDASEQETRRNHTSTKERGQDGRPENISMASKGMNLAFNTIQEIFRFSTKAAETWGLTGIDPMTSKHSNDPRTRASSMASAVDGPRNTMLQIASLNDQEDELKRLEQISEFQDEIDDHEDVPIESSNEKDPADTLQHLDIEATDTSSYLNGDTLPSVSPQESFYERCLYIRKKLFQQGMKDVVKVAMVEAKTPSDALDSIRTLQSMLLQDPKAKRVFAHEDGYRLLAEMLLRIENNMDYLLPCRDTSIAIASGSNACTQQPPELRSHSSLIDSNQRFTRLQTNRSKVFLSIGGDEFDSYYIELYYSLLSMIFDEYSFYTSSLSNLSAKGSTKNSACQIMDIHILTKVLPALIRSGFTGLIMITTRICYTCLRINPVNIVGLECGGLISLFISLLSTLSLYGSLRLSPEIGMDSIESFKAAVKQDELDIRQLKVVTSEVLDVLQLAAVIQSGLKDSILGILTLQLLLLVINDEELNLALYRMDDQSLQPNNRVPIRPAKTFINLNLCQNCEQESAKFECTQFGCVNDKHSQLCFECDVVFHKSVAKKGHIRLPMLGHCRSDRTVNKPKTETKENDRKRMKNNYARDVLNSILTSEIVYLSDVFDLVTSVIDENDLKALTTQLPSIQANTILKVHESRVDVLEVQIDRTNRLNRISSQPDGTLLRECMLCLILGSIRGLLDDRQARNLIIPSEIFPAIIISNRKLLSYPILQYGNQSDDPVSKVLHEMGLSEIIDRRSDAINDQQVVDLSRSPPEHYYSSSRRVCISLFSQLVARFVVSPEYPEQIASERIPSFLIFEQNLYLRFLQLCGMDGLYSFILVEPSNNSHVTMIEKHFIVWLLRETIVTSWRVNTLHSKAFAEKLVYWIMWIIKGSNTSKSVEIGRSSLLSKKKSRKVSLPVRLLKEDFLNKMKILSIPTSHPVVPPMLRLIIIFELRILLTGNDSRSQSIRPLQDDDEEVTSQLDCISMTRRHYIAHINTPSTSAFLNETSSRHNSFEFYKERDEDSPSLSRVSLASGQHSQVNRMDTTIPFHVVQPIYGSNFVTNSKNIKDKLIDLGLLKLLTSLVFGELSNEKIISFISVLTTWNLIEEVAEDVESNKANNNGLWTAAQEDALQNKWNLTELEKEDWWASFVLLTELLSGCDQAKEEFDKVFGLQKFINIMVSLIHYESMIMETSVNLNAVNVLDQATQNGLTLNSAIRLPHSPNPILDTPTATYCSTVLLSLIVEVCVENERFTPHSLPAYYTTTKLPLTHKPESSTNAALSSPSIKGKQTAAGNSLLQDSKWMKKFQDYNENFPSIPVESTGRILSALFFRSYTYFYRQCIRFETQSSSFTIQSDLTHFNTIASLSPIYFLDDRTANMLHCILNPIALNPLFNSKREYPTYKQSFSRSLDVANKIVDAHPTFPRLYPEKVSNKKTSENASTLKNANSSFDNIDALGFDISYLNAITTSHRTDLPYTIGSNSNVKPLRTINREQSGSSLSKRSTLASAIIRGNQSSSLLSNLSVHSFDPDNISNRWEVESNSRASSIQGDREQIQIRQSGQNPSYLGSNSSSHHSLVNLALALRSLPQQDHQTPSQTGYNYENTYLTMKESTVKRAAALKGAPESKSTSIPKLGHAVPGEDEVTIANWLENFPYPPVLGYRMDQCIPLIYIPVLNIFDCRSMTDRSGLLPPNNVTATGCHSFVELLLILHHSLLIRSGLSQIDVENSADQDITKSEAAPTEPKLNSEPMIIDMSNAQREEIPPIESNRNINQTRLDILYKIMLRRHLALFLPPQHYFESYFLQKRQTELLSNGWKPSFSRLTLRTPHHALLLLQSAIAMHDEPQLYLLSVISYLLDGNPANAFQFIETNDMPNAKLDGNLLEVTESFGSLTEGSREAVGYILSQIYRYSINQKTLKTMIKILCRLSSSNDAADDHKGLSESGGNGIGATTNQISIDQQYFVNDSESQMPLQRVSPVNKPDDDDIDKTESFRRNLLFMLGRIAERECPVSYLHFNSNISAISSGVEVLPPICSLPPSSSGFSVCGWLRLGSIGNSNISSLFQLSVPSMKMNTPILIDAYFRLLYKVPASYHSDNSYPINRNNYNGSSVTKDSDINSTVSGVSNFPNGTFSYVENDTECDPTGLKKIIQLCISISNHTNPTPVICDPVYRADKYGKPSTLPGVGNNEVAVPRENSELSPEALWNIAIDRFVYKDNKVKDGHISSQKGSRAHNQMDSNAKFDQVSILSSTISRYTIPDYVIDFDWTELGNWHLLSLSFRDSDGLVSCTVDAKPQPIFRWTPYGYQYIHAIPTPTTAEGKANKPSEKSLKGSVEGRSSVHKDAPLHEAHQNETETIIKSDFFDSSQVSASNPLRFSLGGLLFETDSYESIVNSLLLLKNEISELQRDVQTKPESMRSDKFAKELLIEHYNQLLNTMNQLVGGFSGSIGEFCLLEGSDIDLLQLNLCMSVESQYHLNHVKGTRFCAMIPDQFAAQTIEQRASSVSPTKLQRQVTPFQIIDSGLISTIPSKHIPQIMGNLPSSTPSHSSMFPYFRPISPPILPIATSSTTSPAVSSSIPKINSEIVIPAKLSVVQSNLHRGPKYFDTLLTSVVSNNFLERKVDKELYNSSYKQDEKFPKKDLFQLDHSIKFRIGASLHRTQAMLNAIMSLGGLKVLYPLLSADKISMIGSLRIISCFISQSQKQYPELLHKEGTDAVILYLCNLKPHIVSLETVQILIDLVINRTYQSSNHSIMTLNEMEFNAILPTADMRTDHEHTVAPIVRNAEFDYIKRPQILALLIEIVLSAPSQNIQLTRNAIDSIREICDEVPENCQKVIKMIGIIPISILLSNWTCIMSITDQSTDCLNEIRRVSTSESTDKGKIVRDSNSNVRPSKTGASQPLIGAAIDISVSKGRDTASTASRKPIDIDAMMEVYKLQRSCAKFLKVMITGTSGSVPIGELQHTSTRFSTSITSFIHIHLTSLLALAGVAARFDPNTLKTEKSSRRSINEATDDERSSDLAGKISRRTSLQVIMRLKQALLSTFGYVGTINILKNISFTSPHYWMYSGAVASVDSVLDLVGNGAFLDGMIINMVKASFSGSNLWYILLEMMGCNCIELRERGTRLLMLALSTQDGKIDSKALIAFDRIHGFQLMSDKLCTPLTMEVDSSKISCCTPDLVECVMNLMFWKPWMRKSQPCKEEPEHLQNPVEASQSNNSNAFEASRGFRLDMTNTSESGPLKSTSIVTASLEKPTVSAQNSTPGGLFSLFGWNSNNESAMTNGVVTGNSSSPQIESNLITTFDIPPENAGKMITSEPFVNKPVTLPTTTSIDGYPNIEVNSISKSVAVNAQQSSLLSALFKSPHISASTTASTFEESHQISNSNPDKMNSLQENPSEVGKQHSDNVSHEVSPDIHTPNSAIEVPQAFEVLIHLLQHTTSSELILQVFAKLEKSISLISIATLLHTMPNYDSSSNSTIPSQADINNMKLTDERNKKNQPTSSSNIPTEASVSNAVLKEHNELSYRNAECIFTHQRDWIQWLCDLLIIYRRNVLNSLQEESRSNAIPLSEMDGSLGTSYGSSSNYMEPNRVTNGVTSKNYSYGDVIDSADDLSYTVSNQDAYSVCASDELGISIPSNRSRSLSWQRNQLTLFWAPPLRFIRKLLVLDMRLKANYNRRWNDVFRLSLPETQHVQEAILSELVNTLTGFSLPSIFLQNVDIMMNYLRNMAMLFEQSLEKVDVTLSYCVKVLTSLHHLSYKCPVDIRSRLKETSLLTEIRKQFVIRSILDDVSSGNSLNSNPNEFSLRIKLMASISSPLSSYLSSNETKLIPDSHILSILLGLLAEIFENIDALHHQYQNPIRMEVFSSETQNNRDDLYGRFRLVVDVMYIVFQLVHTCVSSSMECKKFLLKMLSEGVGNAGTEQGQSNIIALLRGFLNDFQYHGVDRTKGPHLIEPEEKSVVIRNDDVEAQQSLPDEDGVKVKESIALDVLPSSPGLTSTSTEPASTSNWWFSSLYSVGSSPLVPTNPTSPTIDLEKGGVKADHGLKDATISIQLEEKEMKEMSSPTVVRKDSLIPTNLMEFMDWMSSSERMQIRSELRNRILIEMKPAVKNAEKLKERCTYRYIKYSRSQQDRLMKEKQLIARYLKEGFHTCQSSVDKIIIQYQKELIGWCHNLKEKMEDGRIIYENSERDNLNSE